MSSVHDFFNGVVTDVTLNTASSSVDAVQLDSSNIQVILTGGQISLAPSAIELFNPDEFGFLEDEEKRKLVEGVMHLREITSKGPIDASAKTEKVSQAQSDLQSIIEVLRPDKYGDPDAFEIGKRTERELHAELGERIRSFRFETGKDANGDPAVWVWVIVEDEAATRENFSEIRERLDKILRKVAPDRWPYIRFRTVSEQQIASKPQLEQSSNDELDAE